MKRPVSCAPVGVEVTGGTVMRVHEAVRTTRTSP